MSHAAKGIRSQTTCLHGWLKSDEFCYRATAEREVSEGYRECGSRSMADNAKFILVAMRSGDTPVPIPNTKVKT